MQCLARRKWQRPEDEIQDESNNLPMICFQIIESGRKEAKVLKKSIGRMGAINHNLLNELVLSSV
jgi:hypothetical protein